MKIEDVFKVVSDSQNIVVRYERPSVLSRDKEVIDQVEGTRGQLRLTLFDTDKITVNQIYPVDDDLVVRVNINK